jgi:hypothetical protein
MTINLAQVSTSDQPPAQDMPALKRVFETIQADSCPRFYNFHMHTVYSDGHLQPEELVEQAIAIGLKGFTITDHHSVSGYQVAQRWLEGWQQLHYNAGARSNQDFSSLPYLWTGVEITSILLGTEVHILGYAFDPEHPSLKSYLQGQAPRGKDAQASHVIETIHQAGGLAVLAHPARYRRSPAELIPEAARVGIDGIETYYAYANPQPWKPSPVQTQQVQQLGEVYGLLNTCGTDTHGFSLLQRL